MERKGKETGGERVIDKKYIESKRRKKYLAYEGSEFFEIIDSFYFRYSILT